MSMNFEQWKRSHNIPTETKFQQFAADRDSRSEIQTDKPAPGQWPTPRPDVGYAAPQER